MQTSTPVVTSDGVLDSLNPSHSHGAGVRFLSAEVPLELRGVSAKCWTVECFGNVVSYVANLLNDVVWASPSRRQLGLVRMIVGHLLENHVAELELDIWVFRIVSCLVLELDFARTLVRESSSFFKLSDGSTKFGCGVDTKQKIFRSESGHVVRSSVVVLHHVRQQS